VRNESNDKEPVVAISIDSPIGTEAFNSAFYAARSVATGALGLARFATETTVYLVTESTKVIANSILDTVVPVAVNAVVSRIDINKIVAQVDITPILDRVPMTEIADYIIEEIDLPSLVRESTGGVADGLLGTLRFQAIQTDNFVSDIVDRIFFRQKMRATTREVLVGHATI